MCKIIFVRIPKRYSQRSRIVYNDRLESHCTCVGHALHIDHIAFINLNGNNRIAPTSFKTASSVKATILKGNRINQIKGNSTNTSSAMGQQHINRKHQSIRAISVRIDDTICSSPAKRWPRE